MHFQINLRASERDALVRLAKEQRRDPRDQAAVIIRTELERRGLLPFNPPPNETAKLEEVSDAPTR